ncbi:MAG: NADH-quinone oxidoreductase subunit A [Magnetococcus sp. XQGC-1]
MMLESYFPILILLLVATGIAAGALGVSYLVGPRRPSAQKDSPYECGFAPFGRIRVQFDVRFYLISILFIVFDIESAFLFPWAVAFSHIGIVGFVEMILFLLVLLVGYAYAWKKGALEWE